MEVSDWLTIVAILLAPAVAVQVQKWSEDRRSKTERRKRIFQTLMATRAAPLLPDHVHALNSIDMEFKGVSEVQGAWHDYLAHLNDPATPPDLNRQAAWNATSAALLGNLLYEMSRSLGYGFDRSYLRSSSYRPQAYAWEEQFHQGVKFGLAQLLTNQYALPVRLVPEPPQNVADGGRDEEQLGADRPATGDQEEKSAANGGEVLNGEV